MNIKLLQLQKKAADSFDKIEDSYSINTANQTIAVSDGATQGYYSGIWARILVKEFVNNPVFEPGEFFGTFLPNCRRAYYQAISVIPAHVDVAMNILIKDKKKEGAYATLIAVQITPDNICKVVSCGDSNLFRLAGVSINSLNSFPFKDSKSLNNENVFIHTNIPGQQTISYDSLKICSFQIYKEDEIYLMTDALSRYLLADHSRITELRNINTFDQFLSFSNAQWDYGKLENDDLTMIKIVCDDEKYMAVDEQLPPHGFTFQPGKNAYPANVKSMEIVKLQNQLKCIHLEMSDMKNKYLPRIDAPAKRIYIYPVAICLILLFLGSILILVYSNYKRDKSLHALIERVDKISKMQKSSPGIMALKSEGDQDQPSRTDTNTKSIISPPVTGRVVTLKKNPAQNPKEKKEMTAVKLSQKEPSEDSKSTKKNIPPQPLQTKKDTDSSQKNSKVIPTSEGEETPPPADVKPGNRKILTEGHISKTHQYF